MTSFLFHWLKLIDPRRCSCNLKQVIFKLISGSLAFPVELPSGDYLYTLLIISQHWLDNDLVLAGNKPLHEQVPDSKVRGAYMGSTWVRQDPGGPHVGPMNLAIRGVDQDFQLIWQPWLYDDYLAISSRVAIVLSDDFIHIPAIVCSVLELIAFWSAILNSVWSLNSWLSSNNETYLIELWLQSQYYYTDSKL